MRPRAPALGHATASRLAATEHQRCLNLLRKLAPEDWDKRTDCPEWEVRQVAAHILGMLEMAASVRETMRTQRLADRAAARSGRALLDELNDLHVSERTGSTPLMIIERFAARTSRAESTRRRVSYLGRGLPMPGTQRVNGVDEPWTIGYLIDVILIRDFWMHRIDISRATSAPLVLTADHDGVIMADIVDEWYDRHGKDCSLVLDGPAGGTWAVAAGGSELRADAIEFARALSGRRTSLISEHLLHTRIPF